MNAQGEGPVATVTATPVLGPPGAPRELIVTPMGPSEILLSWKPPADTGEAAVTGYRIEVSVDDGSRWGVLVATVNATTYRHTGLYGGTTRRYRVSAVNSSGAGGPSEPEGATTDRGPPAAPRALRAAPGDAEVTLSWDAPSSDGGSAIERYEYRVGGSGQWIGPVTVRRVTVAGLVNGRSYGFEVRAVNAQGPGEAATVRSAAGSVRSGDGDVARGVREHGGGAFAGPRARAAVGAAPGGCEGESRRPGRWAGGRAVRVVPMSGPGTTRRSGTRPRWASMSKTAAACGR